jgi:hypothetical protein
MTRPVGLEEEEVQMVLARRAVAVADTPVVAALAPKPEEAPLVLLVVEVLSIPKESSLAQPTLDRDISP